MSTSTKSNTRKKNKNDVLRGKSEIEIAEGDLTTLAGRFIAARKSVGLSPAQLSRELQLSRSAICRIEQGKSTKLRSSTLSSMELVTHHRALWIETGDGPRLVTDDPDALSARQVVFTMSPDQLRDSILAQVDVFSKDDIRIMIDALLNRLHQRQ